MEEVFNPHDKLFRETLSRNDIAQDILSNVLPPEIKRHVGLNSLKISKDTFIEKELKDYYSDLL